MPSPITVADLNGTNLPQVLVEVALMLTNAEKAVPIETRPERVSVTYSAETEEFTIAATVPATVAVNATGLPTMTPVDYIP